jgi:AcrR family transcriptional regulator
VLACDFLTVETAFLQRIYVLFFISVATRRIEYVACTSKPDGGWVAQQARNLIMQLGDEQRFRFLIHDRDTKFSLAFDGIFRSEGIKVIRTPVQAPNANAYAERWVRTLRADCLDPDPHPRPPSPRARAPRLPASLQRAQATPRAQPPATKRARPDATERARSPTPSRSPRRTHQRIRGRLSLRTLRAIELHGTLGPSRTTMSAVAERASVERRTLYRHFPSEADLFAACSTHYFAANPWPDLGSSRAVRDPHQRLERAPDELYAYYERTAPMYSNVLRDAEPVDFARDAVAPLHTYLEEAAQILTAGRPVRGRRRHLLSERCDTPSPSPRGSHSRPPASHEQTQPHSSPRSSRPRSPVRLKPSHWKIVAAQPSDTPSTGVEPWLGSIPLSHQSIASKRGYYSHSFGSRAPSKRTSPARHAKLCRDLRGGPDITGVPRAHVFARARTRAAKRATRRYQPRASRAAPAARRCSARRVPRTPARKREVMRVVEPLAATMCTGASPMSTQTAQSAC